MKRWPTVRIPPLPTGMGKALILAQVLAVGWWLVAYYLRATGKAPAWYDQETTFLVAPTYWLTPYSVLRYVSPPWAAVLLLPLHWLPFYLAVLVQACLYLGLLTAVIFKLGGNLTAALIMMTSFIALDAVIELNIDWLICLGLLLPAWLSGPFLLIKPQDALGIWITYSRKDLRRAVLVTLLVLIISLLVWGVWPLQMYRAVQLYTMGQSLNLAPVVLISVPLSLVIGGFLAWRAFKKRDPAMAILAWLFFVPYVALYSLLITFAALTVRYPRLALLISVVMWIIYGRVLLIGVLR